MKEQKVNILVITDTSLDGVGGSENHIRSMLKWMLKTGKYRIFVVQLGLGRFKEFEQRDAVLFSSKYLHIYHYPLSRIYGLNFFLVYLSIFKIIRKHCINVSISFHEKSDILSAVLPDSVLKISSRRDMAINPSQLLLWLRKVTVRRFDVITAPCRAILDCAASKENLSSLQTVVIYNGLDIEAFCPSIQPDEAVLRMKGNGVAGICVGNFRKVKGHRYLVKAFKIVCEAVPVAKLFLLGSDHGTLPEINNLIKNYGLEDNIILLGHRSDIANVLTACDYIVSPSLSEGLSNSLIEGIACGLPVVATDVGGNSEIVQNGRNGFLIPPHNEERLAKALLHFYEDDCVGARMSAESRKVAVQKFDIKKNMPQYGTLLTGRVGCARKD